MGQRLAFALARLALPGGQGTRLQREQGKHAQSKGVPQQHPQPQRKGVQRCLLIECGHFRKDGEPLSRDRHPALRLRHHYYRILP